MSRDAIVIGSGPNGLSAAVVLARAGLSVQVHEAQPVIGGGTRTDALTLPGFAHDVCSAVHPMAIASPFFRELALGVEWVHPDIPLAHPLDDGTAVVLGRSLDETVESVGSDARAYRALVSPFVARCDDLLEDALAPVLRVPRHPLLMLRFGARAALPATLLASLSFGGERARALFAGCAAHAFLPPSAPLTGSFALLFAAVAHAYGWPVARGGSQRIAEALAAELRAYGGEIVVGDRVNDMRMLGDARAYLFDTSPEILERVAGDRLAAPLRRPRRGPGIFKIDYALRGPVPWRAEECRRAGTVHVGGSLEDIDRAEREVADGKHAERPFVLVAQQSLFDASRAPPGFHTLWAYCHVPNGSSFDMTSRIEAQIERFAPGFRDLVMARSFMTTREVEEHDANFAGGDISGGLSILSKLGYTTAARDIYLCSASTAPGPGVHGMCGYHAAMTALRRSFREKRTESSRPRSDAPTTHRSPGAPATW